MIGIASALLFALLLGGASIFSRRGMTSGSFYALLVTSLVVAAPVFFVLAMATTGFADAPAVAIAYGAVGGVVGSVVGRSMYFLGIQYLGPGKSLSINATAPLYAAVLAWIVLNEELTTLVVVGTVAIVVGIVALSKDVRTQTDHEDYSLLVTLFPLISAVLAAVAVTFRKLALSSGLVPIEAAAVNFGVGLLVVVPPLATGYRDSLLSVDRTALRNFLAASGLMAVAFVFYFVGLELTNASIFFPLIQTQPLIAVLLSAVFLRDLEVITRWTALGSAVIVAGAAMVVVG